MNFKNLITLATFLAFIISDFVCSAAIDFEHNSLAIRAEKGIRLES